jgi:hypothetical protein
VILIGAKLTPNVMQDDVQGAQGAKAVEEIETGRSRAALIGPTVRICFDVCGLHVYCALEKYCQ